MNETTSASSSEQPESPFEPKFEPQFDFDVRAIKHPAYTADVFGVVRYVNQAFVNFLLSIDNRTISVWQQLRDRATESNKDFSQNLRKDTWKQFEIHARAAVARHKAELKRAGDPLECIPDPYSAVEGEHKTNAVFTPIIGKHIVEVILNNFNPNKEGRVHPGLTAGAYLCNLFGAYVLRGYLFGNPETGSGFHAKRSPTIPDDRTRAERFTKGCLKRTDTSDQDWCSSFLDSASFDDIDLALTHALAEDNEAEIGKLRGNPPTDDCACAIGQWLSYCSAECEHFQSCREVLDGVKTGDSDDYDWKGFLASRDAMRQEMTSVEWAFVRMEGVEVRGQKYLNIRANTELPLILDIFATFKSNIAFGCQGMFQLATRRMDMFKKNINLIHEIALEHVRHEFLHPMSTLAAIRRECREVLPDTLAESGKVVKVDDVFTGDEYSIAAGDYPEKLLQDLATLIEEHKKIIADTIAIMKPEISEHVAFPTANIVAFCRKTCEQYRVGFKCIEKQSGLMIRADGQPFNSPFDRKRWWSRDLEVVFENMIRNAKQNYEPKTEASNCVVDIVIERSTTRDGFIEIQIGDNGPGFRQNVLDLLMEGEFPSTKPRDVSRGRGLRICRAIVGRHRSAQGIAGEVKPSNRKIGAVAKGALVTLSLPEAEQGDRYYEDL